MMKHCVNIFVHKEISKQQTNYEMTSLECLLKIYSGVDLSLDRSSLEKKRLNWSCIFDDLLDGFDEQVTKGMEWLRKPQYELVNRKYLSCV